MRKLFLFVMVFFSLYRGLAQDNGYRIAVTLKPYHDTWVYLGNYYGKFKNLSDSVYLDKDSKGVLKGDQKLPQGIYFLVSPSKSLLFDFLMDDHQRFSIVADTTQSLLPAITGSQENIYYNGYVTYISAKGKEIQGLQEQLKTARTHSDSVALRTKVDGEMKAFETYRHNFVKQHPDALLSAFFESMQRPVVPEKIAKDTLAAFNYIKDHYWDNVDFSNDALLHTPFFDPKVDDYYKYYVSPVPDSVIKEVNYMLLSAREGKEMYRYLLGKFTDKYINPEIMGQDKVFLFLFNNYFSKGDTSWLNGKQKEFIFNRAYSLMANQIGESAPSLALKDTAGVTKPLSSLDGKFTFVLFWDPECSHCKVIVPEVDSIYRAKWKALGVRIYAVNTAEESAKSWKAFIDRYRLQDWTNVMQSKEERETEAKKQVPNYRQLYDVTQTPTMFLLDEQKRIIAKKLTVQQFDDLIAQKNKTVKP